MASPAPIDDRIRVLAGQLASVREAWEVAERRAARAEERLRVALSLAQEQASFNARVEKVISMAKLQAAGIRSLAEHEASIIREEARAAATVEVEKMLAAAQRLASYLPRDLEALSADTADLPTPFQLTEAVEDEYDELGEYEEFAEPAELAPRPSPVPRQANSSPAI